MLAPAAFAQNEATEARARVAQIVTLAKLAPLLCPWIEANEDAVQDLLRNADLTERDVMDPNTFGVQDELVARSFAESRKRDGDQACVDLYATFGDGGAGLLRHKSSAPG